jgi:flagellar capping protein FliD
MTGYYTRRQDIVVDRLGEAVKTLIKSSGEIFTNRIVRIEGELTKSDNAIKSQILPDM